MKKLKVWLLPVTLGVLVSSTPQRALADEYDESQSHPLRLVAYVTHPVGVALEWTVTRPFHFLVSSTRLAEYVFGHKPHGPAIPQIGVAGYGVTRRAMVTAPARPGEAAPLAPVSERVIVKEVPVETIVTVVKEVPKEVAPGVPQVVGAARMIFPDIAFRFNSAELTDLGKGKAYLAAQMLKENAELVVAVEGHTDAAGSDEYNEQLGLRRAERVIKELTELGVDPARMSALSLAGARPLIDLETDWARAVNRRVEFSVKAP